MGRVFERDGRLKESKIQKPERQQRLFGLSTPLRSAVIPPLSAARWLLVLIVAAGVYFFHGFLFPVLAALVIAFASWPLYRRLLAGVGGNRTIAATLAILFILALSFIAPLFTGCSGSSSGGGRRTAPSDRG